MITPLICSLALFSARQQGQFWSKVDLPPTPNSLAKLYYQTPRDPQEPPRLSPKKFGEDKIQWEFPWIVAGYCHLLSSNSFNDIRFRVYSQEQKGSRAEQVTRMLLRLWELNAEHLKLDHNPTYHGGLVDVFLCFGGKAGGEQLFDKEIFTDPTTGKTQTFGCNTIYIYDMPSFNDPVEMAREIAHEYGHATLPPIGIFKEPEEWTDGYLGEKLSLRWLRDSMEKGEITPDDVMGATKAQLDKFVVDNIDPLVLKAAQTLPTAELFDDKSAAGMNAFIGLALYIETIYPDNIFFNTLKFSGSFNARDYVEGVLRATSAPEEVTLKIPPSFFGHAIWLPLGKGKLTGAKILKFDKNGWVQVIVRNDPIVIKNPPE